jgi:hypothetical protein
VVVALICAADAIPVFAFFQLSKGQQAEKKTGGDKKTKSTRIRKKKVFFSGTRRKGFSWAPPKIFVFFSGVASIARNRRRSQFGVW